MQNKSAGIIGTIAAVVLCGCPGLFLCIFGAVTATGNMPFSTEFNGVGNSGILPSRYGFVMLCLSLVFILIPVAVGFFTLRKKPDKVSDTTVDV